MDVDAPAIVHSDGTPKPKHYAHYLGVTQFIELRESMYLTKDGDSYEAN